MVIKRVLEWQVEGDQAKSNTFRDKAINQTVFCAFAFVKGKLPVVHMAHSVGQYFDMSGLAAKVKGKYFRFIKDRGKWQTSRPVHPPMDQGQAPQQYGSLRGALQGQKIGTSYGQQKQAKMPSQKKRYHASSRSLPSTFTSKGELSERRRIWLAASNKPMGGGGARHLQLVEQSSNYWDTVS